MQNAIVWLPAVAFAPEAAQYTPLQSQLFWCLSQRFGAPAHCIVLCPQRRADLPSAVAVRSLARCVLCADDAGPTEPYSLRFSGCSDCCGLAVFASCLGAHLAC